MKQMDHNQFVSCNQKDIQNMDLISYILIKFTFINILRNSLINDWNKTKTSKIKKLSGMQNRKKNNEKFFKKKNNNDQIDHLKITLNDFSHSSDWILWNEISLKNIIKIIKKNFNFQFFRSTSLIIKKMDACLEKIKELITQEKLYKKDFLDDIKNFTTSGYNKDKCELDTKKILKHVNKKH